jgi:hypothetical protein
MNEIKRYLSEIGARGGKKSRRTLSTEEARAMVNVREARRAFLKYKAQCFWSHRPDLEIDAGDVSWVADQLMKHGDREAWRLGARLCR